MSFLSTKKNKEACGEFDGLILPNHRFSSRKSSVPFCSLGVSGNTFPTFGMNESSRFISWSQFVRGEISVLPLLKIRKHILCIFREGWFLSVC